MIRAAGYFRVSSKRQAGIRNVSLEIQRERFLGHCLRNGYTPAGEYTDVFTGRKSDREEYQLLLRECQAGRVDVVVSMFLDRFGRDKWEILRQVLNLQVGKVTVECTDEDVSDFIRLVLSSWKADEEVKRISERVRSAALLKVQQGVHWGPTPFGWDKIQGRLVVNETEAAVVRHMYDLIVGQNLSQRMAAERLNAEGLRRRSGRLWTPEAVGQTVRRNRNAGEILWGCNSVENRHVPKSQGVPIQNPAILTVEQVRTASETLRSRRLGWPGRSLNSEYLLVGLLFCGHCGHRMYGSKSTKGSKRYTCPRRFGSVCPARSNYQGARRLEAAILDALTPAIDRAAAAALVQAPEDSSRLEAQSRRLAGELAAIEREYVDAYRLYRSGAIKSERALELVNEDLQRRQRALESRQSDVDTRLAAQERLQEDADLMREQAKRLADYRLAAEPLPIPVVRGELSRIIRRVSVWRSGEIEIQFLNFS